MIESAETVVDVYENTNGGFALDWSQDHCIALSTYDHVLLYDMNPLKNICIPKTSFSVQAIDVRTHQNHNDVDNKLSQFNMRRAVPSKSAAFPCIESYKLFLHKNLGQNEDDDQVKPAGSWSVKFSPIFCSNTGGTVLAVLDQRHQLILYSRSLNGLILGWSEIHNLSEVLARTLHNKENLHLNTSNDWKSFVSSKFVEDICCFAWSEIYTISNEKCVFMATATRSNHLVIWRMITPISTSSKISILNYLPTKIGLCSCVRSLKKDEENSLYFAIGSVDGRLKCIKISAEKEAVETSSLVWSEKDEIPISDICWSNFQNEHTFLLLAKGSSIIFFTLSFSFDIISSSIVKGFHASAIVNIASIGSNSWVCVSQEGTQSNLWLENDSNKNSKAMNPKCTLNSLGNKPIYHLCPEITHHFMISPNHVFLASVTSRPKVTATVQSDWCGVLRLKYLKQQTFPEIVANIERWDSRTYPRLDTWEFIRMQLLNKDLENAQVNKLEYKETLKQFIESKGAELKHRWYAAKILEGADPENVDFYSSVVCELEKLLVIKQMMKVLKEWCENDCNKEHACLPVRSIVAWLEDNQCMLTSNDEIFLKKVKQNQKFNKHTETLCSISKEKLSLSKNAKWAITEKSKIEWPCCCLTFRALENFESRKCEICNCRALNTEVSDCACVKKLLEANCSIYSGCSLV